MNSVEKTPLFLMANLGSEIYQLFSEVEKGNFELAKKISARANSIITELMVHPDLGNGRAEIEIIKNIVGDMFLSERKFKVNNSQMSEYFMPFAIRYMSTRNQ